MKIYTSYFGNLKNLKKNHIIPIGVCRFPPKWFDGPNLISIAPSKDILFTCKNNHQEYITKMLLYVVLKNLANFVIDI